MTIVHRLELAVVNRNARLHKQTHLPTEFDKARAHLADRSTIVLPEIGNRFVVRNRASTKPTDDKLAAPSPPAPHLQIPVQ